MVYYFDKKLVELLDHLHLTVEETGSKIGWILFLLIVIRSPGGIQRLSHQHWEFLVELAVSEYWRLESRDADVLKTAGSLIGAGEWDKLECWIGTVWAASEAPEIPEEDLEHLTLLLFRQRPGAAQKLEQWMERWSQQYPWTRVPESFQRILTRAHEAVQRPLVT